MKICLVAEGCYPYGVGGVSAWVHDMIKAFPNVEFVLLTLIADRSVSKKFVYELPENLTEVHEVYLDDQEWTKGKGKKAKLKKEEYQALRSLIFNKNVDWGTLFDLFGKEDFSVDNLLMGKDFLDVTVDFYESTYPNATFSDFLWTLRSVYLPLFTVLRAKVPKADLYHCVSTGYAGILGCMGQHFHKGKLLISEHGIYTREREEELIKAEWITGLYRNIWIQQFKKMSQAAYDKADVVTSLYEAARVLQLELGCPADKTRVTPNGIMVERWSNIPGKQEDEMSYINVGAILRVAPIKDVKTLIQAFALAKKKVKNLKLWIMGPCEEDEEYAQECFEMVQMNGVEDIIFTGRVNVPDYMGRMDMTILTSISEGQPLTILESFASHKPVICTDVGCCRELIYGNQDGFGAAGILTHIMNVDEIADAIVTLACDEKLRKEMGDNGYQRLDARYRLEYMKKTYEELYQGFCDDLGKFWDDMLFQIKR